MKHFLHSGLSFSLLVFVCATLNSQITFQKTFESSGDEGANWVANTSTGYIVAGYVNSPNSGRDGYLLNLDFNGNPIWQKRYIGGNGVDGFNVVFETDGGFLVLGNTENSADGGSDVWLLKISQAGNILWSKTIGDPAFNDLGNSMIPVSGNRILIGGAQTPTGATGYNSCFYLLDDTGQMIWSRYFESGSTGNLMRCNYVDNGVVYASGAAESDGVLLRLDLETGGIIDAVQYPGNSNEAMYYQQPTADGNILLSDGTWSATNGAELKQWVNKVRPDGQTLWSKVYSGPNHHNLRGRVESAGDGNFLLTPYDAFFSPESDPILAKIDEGGNVMWSRNYGKPGPDWLIKSQLTPDGGFVSVGGATGDNGDANILIIKTDYEGLIEGCCISKAGIIAETFEHEDQTFTFSTSLWASPAPGNNQQVNTGLQERPYCANLPVQIFHDVPLCPNDVFTFHGVDYYAPDEVLEVLPGLFGCDTTVHYKLLLLTQVTRTETITFCKGASVTLLGQNYYEPDTIVQNITPPSGCDTITTYYLVYDTVAANCFTCEGTFLKIVGDEGQELRGHGIYDAGDGNFYVTGTKQDSVLLIKMKPSGSIIWSRTFDILPNVVDNLAELIVDSEGVLAGVGQSGDNQPITAGFAFRYDPVNDVMLWTRIITTGSPFVLGILEKSPGGNYIMNSNPHSPGDNVQLTELSRADGSMVQSPITKILGTGNEDSFNSALLSDGKMYAVGRLTGGNQLTDMRHSLTRLDVNTGVVETSIIGHSFLGPAARLYGMDLVLEEDKIVSVGYGNETGGDLTNTKIFMYNGNTLLNYIGEPIRINLLVTSSEAADEIVQVPDGYIILAHSLFGLPADIFLIKVSKMGAIVWSKKIDYGNDQMLPVSIVQSQILAKNGFLYCVATTTSITGQKRMMILKISQDGKMDGDCTYISDSPATSEQITMSSGQTLVFTETPVTDTFVSQAVAVVNSTTASQYLCRELVDETVHITLCEGESVTLGGDVYSGADTVVLTLSNNLGCDSVVTYFIELQARPLRSESISFCSGESVVIGGQSYSQSGTVVDTIAASIGCDTIVTYTLTLLPLQARVESISFCPGESVVIAGHTYTQTATLIDTIPGTVGCDTIVTYTLTLLPQPTRAVSIEFCPGESIVIAGQTYTQPGTVIDTLPALMGCDTIVTYTLHSLLPSPSAVSIHCPNNVSLIAEPGTAPLVTNYDLPTAASDCPCPGLALTLTAGLPSGAAFPNGITQICYNAKDSCGHSASCCFTVTIREEQPCDVKVNGCIEYELLSITTDPDHNLTYRVKVINNCANKLIYTAIQLPVGVTALTPANLSVFTSEAGIDYDIRNPNFSPFYSIRFKSTSDSIFSGQSDIFEYTLPAQSVPVYIDITSRLSPQLFYEAHLNTFNCPIGVNSSKNRSNLPVLLQARHLSLYPNPTEGTLWVDLADQAGEALQWRIFNAQGQQMVAGTSTAEEDLLRIALPQGMLNGLYFYETLTETGARETFRFILQR